MTSTVSEKGQITIPKPLRNSLAWAPGTVVEFAEHDGTLVVQSVRAEDPLSALVGLLPRRDVDAAIDDMRGPSWSPALDEGPRDHRRR